MTGAYFADRCAVLATMHKKEAAIAPLLKQALGLEVMVPEHFNSDRFGTFTRDVDRPTNQLETARLKAFAALELTGETLALASEGSFSPHPAMPFLPCDREIVVLVDRHHDLEIVGEAISTATNFSHAAIATLDEALLFAQKVGFPSHGLVVMPAPPSSDSNLMLKGIVTEPNLITAVTRTLKQFGTAHLETDMRAMYNPTRMQVIAQATQHLISKAKHHCPNCNVPGFSIGEYRHGLPCGLCGQPTAQVLAAIYRCQKCHFEQPKLFPHGTQTADPMYCDFCNP